MNLEYLMKDYTGFNLWANGELVKWLESTSAHLLEPPMQTGFSTLRETILHLWETDTFWLAVLQTTTFTKLPDCGTDEVFSGLIKKYTEFSTYVDSLNESAMGTYCKIDTPWIKDMRPVAEIIHHCMNHSTYHRGQMVIMAQSLGLQKAPNLDYNHYRSEHAKH
ncbi:DinB family protein [Pedobacter sp. PAMC26386]|nr:DinB family protein [Pedobacter sp. PAMC26386]